MNFEKHLSCRLLFVQMENMSNEEWQRLVYFAGCSRKSLASYQLGQSLVQGVFTQATILATLQSDNKINYLQNTEENVYSIDEDIMPELEDNIENVYSIDEDSEFEDDTFQAVG